MRRLKLTDPKIIVAGTVVGGLIGTYLPSVGLALKPIGDLYIAMLSICILPIMMTALISGTGEMLRHPSLRKTFPRFAIVYVTTLTIPCAVALAIGWLIQPGAGLSAEAVTSLGQKMSAAAQSVPTPSIVDFFIGLIPSNIFRDLTTNNFVSIVVFSILLGIGLGFADAPACEETLRVIRTLFAAFSRIFEWILAPLAIGLLCLMAGVTARIDGEVFFSLISFFIAFYAAGLVVFFIYTVALIALRRIDGLRALGGLREPLTMSFLANNPFIALRPTISALVDRLKVEDDVANMAVPFGIIAAQHGQIINVILVTLFLANLYGIDLSPVDIATLAIAGMVGGTAVIGGGATLAPALAPILASLGIPGDLAIIILAASEQIVGPLISLLTIYAAATLVLLGRRDPATAAANRGTPPQSPSGDGA